MNPRVFNIVSLDVGGTKIAGGIVSYNVNENPVPQVLSYRTIPTNAKEGGDAVLARATAFAESFLQEAGFIPGEGQSDPKRIPVLGIGISAAGTVDPHDGSIAFANEIMPGWMGQPVRAHIEQTFGLPCAVLNDVHAHALGELKHGSAAGAQTALVVATGTGVGGAVIVDGHLLYGKHGFAGMLGHTLHHLAEGHRCACGIEGHLEAVASGSGMEACYREAAAKAGRPPEEYERITGPEISKRAYAGEPLALQILDTAGRSLGESIASWASIFDPDVVVVSGSVTNAGPLWRQALDDGLHSRLMQEFSDIKVVDATLGAHAPLIGAAEKLLEQLAQ
ncbi:MAG: ROK family protein [Coriobacteriales bacterium]|nr:ROK family protein [Coriobacteriales bacterium]